MIANIQTWYMNNDIYSFSLLPRNKFPTNKKFTQEVRKNLGINEKETQTQIKQSHVCIQGVLPLSWWG